MTAGAAARATAGGFPHRGSPAGGPRRRARARPASTACCRSAETPRSSPQGTSRTCSAGFRPPPSTAVTTASGPSSACTRTSARPARSSASPTSPHSPSCSAPAVTVSSGTSRSRSTAPRPPRTSQESSCQRTRSAVPDGVSGSAQRQTRCSSSPATVRASTPRRVQDNPCAASTAVQPLRQRARGEGGGVHPVHGRVQLQLDGQLRRWPPADRGTRVQAAGQPVREHGVRPEPRRHVCRRQRAERPQAAQPEPAQQPDQLGPVHLRLPVQLLHPERGEEGARVTRCDGDAAPGGEHRTEQPLRDPGLALDARARRHLVHELLRGRELAPEAARPGPGRAAPAAPAGSPPLPAPSPRRRRRPARTGGRRGPRRGPARRARGTGPGPHGAADRAGPRRRGRRRSRRAPGWPRRPRRAGPG